MSSVTQLPFAGGELSSFDPLDAGCAERTPAAYDATVSRCAISCSGSVFVVSAGFKSPTWPAAPEFWFHVYFGSASSDASQTGVMNFYEGATLICRIDISGYVLTVKTLQSSVLTTVGTITTVGAATLDIRIVAGASGIAAGYQNGTNIFETTGLNHTDFSGVTQIGATGTHNGGANPTDYSQIICDVISHIGDKLVTIAENTVSAVNADWFGPVTNINEIVYDDSLSVTSDTANQISTYYKSGASLGSYNVVGVFIGARAQLNAGSSTNLQICLRTNGSNYFSSTIALDFGFQACCWGWTTNPFTGMPWDTATAAHIEGGMKSIA